METIALLPNASLALPAWYWVATLGASAALIAMVLAALTRAAGRRSIVPSWSAAALVGWAGLSLVLAARGAYHATPVQGPPLIGLGVLIPIVVALALIRRWPALRDAVQRIPQPALIRMQALRMLGILFIFDMVRGQLPPIFAIPAGIGDVVVGAMALAVADVFARDPQVARPLAVSWNLLGLFDLVVAVSIGFFASTTPLRLIAATPATDLISVLPLVMVPVFAVPLFVVLHVVSLERLLRRAPALAKAAS
jgi:hypothetical protein